MRSAPPGRQHSTRSRAPYRGRRMPCARGLQFGVQALRGAIARPLDSANIMLSLMRLTPRDLMNGHILLSALSALIFVVAPSHAQAQRPYAKCERSPTITTCMHCVRSIAKDHLDTFQRHQWCERALNPNAAYRECFRQSEMRQPAGTISSNERENDIVRCLETQKRN